MPLQSTPGALPVGKVREPDRNFLLFLRSHQTPQKANFAEIGLFPWKRPENPFKKQKNGSKRGNFWFTSRILNYIRAAGRCFCLPLYLGFSHERKGNQKFRSGPLASPTGGAPGVLCSGTKTGPLCPFYTRIFGPFWSHFGLFKRLLWRFLREKALLAQIQPKKSLRWHYPRCD